MSGHFLQMTVFKPFNLCVKNSPRGPASTLKLNLDECSAPLTAGSSREPAPGESSVMRGPDELPCGPG